MCEKMFYRPLGERGKEEPRSTEQLRKDARTIRNHKDPEYMKSIRDTMR